MRPDDVQGRRMAHNALPHPLKQREIRPRRRITRELSMSPPPSGQRQSTLTQIDFVSSTQPKRKRQARRSAFAEFECDDDAVERTSKKRRKRTRSSRRKPNNDTLTQAHGFTSTPVVIDPSTDDEEDLFISTELDNASPVASIREGSVVEIPNSSAPCLDDEPARYPERGGPPVETVSSPAGALSLPRTPQKHRFGNVFEIPSSQTPSTAALSTQKTQRFYDADRSPLEERSPNSIDFLDRIGCGSTRAKSNNQTQKRVGFVLPTDDASDESDDLKSPCKVSGERVLHAGIDTFSDNDFGGESLNVDTQLEQQLLANHQTIRTTQDTPQSLPESQVTSMKMLYRAHITQRKLGKDSGLRTPPDSTETKRDSHCAIDGPTTLIASSSSGVPQYATPLAGREDQSKHWSASGSRVRGKLERVSTIQDSEDEDSDDFANIASPTQKDLYEDGREFDVYQNTYDPVNDALERDAARFNSTQRKPSLAEAQHLVTLVEESNQGPVNDVGNQSTQTGNFVSDSQSMKQTSDDGVEPEGLQNSTPVTRIPGSPAVVGERTKASDESAVSGSAQKSQTIVLSSQNALSGTMRQIPPPLQPRPSQVSTVAATQSSPKRKTHDPSAEDTEGNCTIVPSSPIPAPPGLGSYNQYTDTFMGEDYRIPSSRGNASDTNLQFTTAPSSPLPCPPGWNGDISGTNADNKSITQQMQSLADYSLPSLPPISSGWADPDSEL